MNRRRPLLALALLAGLGLGAFALLSPESAAEPAERAAEASSSPARAATAPLPRGSVADAPSVSAPTSASLPSFEPAPGLTGEQLLADVAAFGEAGRMADHGAWLWEAVRRLRAEPALCAELAELALEEGATTQLLALDLLGNAASPEAQEAAVSLLERTTHRRDARVYGRMVQSLLLICSTCLCLCCVNLKKRINLLIVISFSNRLSKYLLLDFLNCIKELIVKKNILVIGELIVRRT